MCCCVLISLQQQHTGSFQRLALFLQSEKKGRLDKFTDLLLPRPNVLCGNDWCNRRKPHSTIQPVEPLTYFPQAFPLWTYDCRYDASCLLIKQVYIENGRKDTRPLSIWNVQRELRKYKSSSNNRNLQAFMQTTLLLTTSRWLVEDNISTDLWRVRVGPSFMDFWPCLI